MKHRTYPAAGRLTYLTPHLSATYTCSYHFSQSSLKVPEDKKAANTKRQIQKAINHSIYQAADPLQDLRPKEAATYICYDYCSQGSLTVPKGNLDSSYPVAGRLTDIRPHLAAT